ncbi:MAG: TenA family protein [Armatimonadota bacterium]|nr:TenA family protein [Armatimonadota bacterium]
MNGLARRLWDEHRDIAERCLAHPFVQGIASGALPRDRFAFYVEQDAFFLETFARAYALALAKSPDREGLSAFKALLDGALDELKLHREYAARWGLTLTPVPSAETRAYTDFLLAVASLEPAGHIAAAMAPCMRLYAYLGQALLPVVTPSSAYREWVDTYSSANFEGLAATLEGLLDRYGGDPARMGAHYRWAMTLEWRFFDAAWRHGA